MRISKPFEKQGGYTEFDNDILDHIMPKLKPSEWMVLCFIIRKTKGWHKDSDAIAYSQFIKGTGIGSNSTIKKCLNNLVDKGMVLIGTTGNKADAHHYMLNKSYSFGITETVERPVTFSVERPVTETVDTKERFKEKETNTVDSIFSEVFPNHSVTDKDLYLDDLDHFGEVKMLEALNIVKAEIMKGKKIYSYNYLVSVLNRKEKAAKLEDTGAKAWQAITDWLNRKTPYNELPKKYQDAIKHVGESNLKNANADWDIPRLKKQVYSYVQ